MCAMSWCDLDLTFDLAYLMLFYVSTRISDTIYLCGTGISDAIFFVVLFITDTTCV